MVISRFYAVIGILYTCTQTEKQRGREKVADNAIFKDYLAQVEQAYKAGNATELQTVIDDAIGEWPLQ